MTDVQDGASCILNRLFFILEGCLSKCYEIKCCCEIKTTMIHTVPGGMNKVYKVKNCSYLKNAYGLS